jgi:hypothetical protein
MRASAGSRFTCSSVTGRASRRISLRSTDHQVGAFGSLFASKPADPRRNALLSGRGGVTTPTTPTIARSDPEW